MATVKILQNTTGVIGLNNGEVPFLKDTVVLNTQIISYDFNEEATPLAPGDTAGSTAQFTVTAIRQSRTDLALDQLVKFDMDDGESLMGIIRDIAFDIPTDTVIFTLDGLWNLFNVDVDIPPVLNVNFRTAVRAWAAAINLDPLLVTVDSRIANKLVNWPGSKKANLWEFIKQVCTAYGYEAYSTGVGIGFRLPGEIELFLTEPDSAKKSISRSQRARKVTLKAHHAALVWNIEAYKADQVFEVDAGETLETTVTIEGSLLSVTNPFARPYMFFTSGAGQYVVTGSDGYIVDPQVWRDNGGNVTAEIGEEYNEIKIKIVGAAIPSRSPFRLSEGEDRPALWIAGTGLVYHPEDITLLTGDTKASAIGVPPEVDNVFLNEVQQTWDRGIHTAQYYGNAEVTLTFQGVPHIRLVRTIAGQNSEELTTKFGFFAGAVARYEDAMYRVTSVNYSPDTMEVTLVEYTTIADRNKIWAGKTFGEMAAALGPDVTFGQLGLRPLTAGGL